jgi:hypothetical protein
MLLSNSITAEAKPIKINNATTFDFKGCVKSSDGNDVICVGTFRNRDADKRIEIFRDNQSYGPSEHSAITDYSGKKYIADEIKISDGKSCRTGCFSLKLVLVEGVDYQAYFIFKDVSLASSQIALLDIKLSGAESIKIRKISMGSQVSSSSENGVENNNADLKPSDREDRRTNTTSSINQPVFSGISFSSCPAGKKTFITAETNNFLVHTCGDSSPTDYMIKIKPSGKGAKIPLEPGSQFTAKVNNHVYFVNRQFIGVMANGKIIGQEAVISYHKEKETKPISEASKPSKVSNPLAGYGYGSLTIYRPNF